MRKLNANQVKTILIDFIYEKKGKDNIICSEVPFLGGKRWADILSIEKNKITAYEIKSELDSLKGLKAQLKDYQNTFDKVYLVLSEKFKIPSDISKNIGIIQIADGRVRKIKTAKTNKKLKKDNLTSFLWGRDLKQHISQKGEVKALRTLFKRNYNIKEIKKIAISCLKWRYIERFKAFNFDRYEQTNENDLVVLTSKDLSF